MTLATMTDRSKPLADRVQAATFLVMKAAVGMSEGTWTKGQNDEADSAMTELLADIATADRLARAAVAERRAMMAYSRAYIVGNNPAGQDTPDATRARHAVNDARAESIAAISAYRERMAQGVGDARP